MAYAVLAGILILLSHAGAAEFAFGKRRMSAMPFLETAGDTVRFPFFGGHDNTLHQLVDIDGDRDLDLFLQLYTDRIQFFENRGDRQRPVFAWSEAFGSSIGKGLWFFFVDIDGDGDVDLVEAPTGNTLAVQVNLGDSDSARFAPLSGPILSVTGQPLGVHITEDMYFADIDCDGDEDLFAATPLGTIRFYRNTGTFREGVPVFEEGRDNYQGFNFTAKPPPAKVSTGSGSLAKMAHGTLNNLTWADFDQDGDLDLVYGDFYDPGLLLVENTGTCREPAYAEPASLLPPETLRTSGGNLARFGDLDGDGVPDLVVSNLQGYASSVSGSKCDLHFFSTRNEEGRRRFERMAPSPFTNVDVGTFATVRTVDIDGDGDEDLFLTNRLDSGSVPRSGLFFYRNVGSARAPVFERQSQDFLMLRQEHSVTLAFDDLDGDGDLDLLTGNFQGTLNLFENRGTRAQPDFRLADSAYMGIDVGQRSDPALADLDGDGDSDLLVGEARGILKCYMNSGTPAKPQFTLSADKFQGIQGGMRAAPALADLDADEDLDLLVCGEDPACQLWLNTGDGKQPRFEAAIPLVAPSAFSPALADLDGDGDPDLLGGTAAGGLAYFENVGRVPFELPISIFQGRPRGRPAPPASRPEGGMRKWRVVLPGDRRMDLRGRTVPWMEP